MPIEEDKKFFSAVTENISAMQLKGCEVEVQYQPLHNNGFSALILGFKNEQTEDFIMKYNYLIAYTFTANNKSTGQGRSLRTFGRKISAIQDILDIEEILCKENDFKQIGINSYQLISEE